VVKAVVGSSFVGTACVGKAIVAVGMAIIVRATLVAITPAVSVEGCALGKLQDVRSRREINTTKVIFFMVILPFILNYNQ